MPCERLRCGFVFTGRGTKIRLRAVSFWPCHVDVTAIPRPCTGCCPRRRSQASPSSAPWGPGCSRSRWCSAAWPRPPRRRRSSARSCMRRWDAQAGKRVADLTRARASDEWRYEERVAELETDLEESRELRVKLEQRLRAKRTELAGLRNEHAALLRRYATAETERASVLEERRVLEIEATAPVRAALPAGTVGHVLGRRCGGGGRGGAAGEVPAVEEEPAVPAVFSPGGLPAVPAGRCRARRGSTATTVPDGPDGGGRGTATRRTRTGGRRSRSPTDGAEGRAPKDEPRRGSFRREPTGRAGATESRSERSAPARRGARAGGRRAGAARGGRRARARGRQPLPAGTATGPPSPRPSSRRPGTSPCRPPWPSYPRRRCGVR